METFERIDLKDLSSKEMAQAKLSGWLWLLNVGLNRWQQGLPMRILKKPAKSGKVIAGKEKVHSYQEK